MAAGPPLALHDVRKCFRRGHEEVAAVEGVSFSVDAGEVVAIVGPSGSGKSTLLHVAGGLLRPDDGRVMLAGVDVTAAGQPELAHLRRRSVGFVFQLFHLLPALTVHENVALPLVLDRRADSTHVDALLEQVGLTARRDHLPSELSGGEMQRAAVARAVVARPAVVLADEPTGNLDSATGDVVLEILLSTATAAGTSVVIVTHDRNVAGRADRVLAMVDGRLVA